MSLDEVARVVVTSGAEVLGRAAIKDAIFHLDGSVLSRCLRLSRSDRRTTLGVEHGGIFALRSYATGLKELFRS